MKRVFNKVGYSMWKTKGTTGTHYVSAHKNPVDDSILMVCSCKGFTIGIGTLERSCFIYPCKHIADFDEEIDVARVLKAQKQ